MSGEGLRCTFTVDSTGWTQAVRCILWNGVSEGTTAGWMDRVKYTFLLNEVCRDLYPYWITHNLFRPTGTGPAPAPEGEGFAFGADATVLSACSDGGGGIGAMRYFPRARPCVDVEGGRRTTRITVSSCRLATPVCTTPCSCTRTSALTSAP